MIILFLLFIGFNKISFEIILLHYLVLVLFLTFCPYFRSKLSYSYRLQVILLGLPLYSPIFFYKIGNFLGDFDFKWLFLGILGVLVILLFFHHRELANHKNNISTLLKISEREALFSLFEFFYYVLGEEIFYRYFIFYFIETNFNTLTFLLVSSLIFVYSHYLNRWADVNFSIKNYISLFCLSVLLGFIYFKTQSLFLCVILHTIYNHSELVVIFKKYTLKESETLLFDDYD